MLDITLQDVVDNLGSPPMLYEHPSGRLLRKASPDDVADYLAAVEEHGPFTAFRVGERECYVA